MPIGSYRYGNLIRQLPSNPPLIPTQVLRFKIKPAPGQKDVTLYLSSRSLSADGPRGQVVWHRPRFEGGQAPTLLLRDYPQFGHQFEIDTRAVFAHTADYLNATVDAANQHGPQADRLRSRGLNPALLKRWIALLAVPPRGKRQAGQWQPLRNVAATPLQLLDARLPKRRDAPPVRGWTVRGGELPIIVGNASDQTYHIPGRVSPHGIAVHPTPTEFVAVVWKSPLEGKFASARVAHAHPACGNGVAWWLEHRHADGAALLAEGALDLGKETKLRPRELKVPRAISSPWPSIRATAIMSAI